MFRDFGQNGYVPTRKILDLFERGIELYGAISINHDMARPTLSREVVIGETTPGLVFPKLQTNMGFTPGAKRFIEDLEECLKEEKQKAKVSNGYIHIRTVTSP